MMTENNEHQIETIEYLKRTSVKYRKALGQYFTPRTARELLLTQLPKLNNAAILDPACGTGEFLLSAKDHFPNPRLYGWEIDEELVNISRNLIPEAHIDHLNTIQNDDFESYDFIIGNPPYYEFKPDTQTKKKYQEITNGRLNIYAVFVYQGIRLLKEAARGNF